MQQQQQQIILLQSIINNKLLSCVIKRECEVKKKLLLYQIVSMQKKA